MSKNDEQKESPKHTHSSKLRTFSSLGIVNFVDMISFFINNNINQ
jgi:hypothetical protein